MIKIKKSIYHYTHLGTYLLDHYQNGFGLVLLKPHLIFALAAFFVCFRELCNRATVAFQVKLGHSVEDSTIGGYRIQTGYNSEQDWTIAFKHILYNLNQILASLSMKD
jgi:hypothetical protein